MEFSLKKFLISFAYGFIFGFASPVPGVSAGTMAILLNVYDKFFSNINMAAAKKNLPSIISFLIGWGIGLLGVSRIMIFLFDNHGQLVSFAFIGLIIGCLPVIYKKATEGKIEIKNVVIFAVAFLAMAFLAFFGGDLVVNNTIDELGGLSAGVLGWIFGTSFVSSMSMLIPGVGGSLMMIVFGIYVIYLESVATLNLVLLATFGVSMVLGVVAGIAITKILLEKFSRGLYSAISGFILGSIFIIFPGFSLDLMGVLSIILAGIGFIFAYKLSKI